MVKQFYIIALILLLVLGGCTGSATSTPTPDPFFAAQGSGEPRGTGYWLLWNSCAPENRSETAASNGGRESGWILMDDLLADPGILLGEHAVTSCEDGLNMLQKGAETEEETTWPLVAQLLAAQLNLAAGAEHCPAIDKNVQEAQLLLLRQGFSGSEDTLQLGPDEANLSQARTLIEQLRRYNSGNLCQ